MSRTISQREVRNDNAEIMRRVEAGESFTVTRNGKPIADLVPHGVPPKRRKTGREMQEEAVPLILRIGPAQEVLENLCRETGIKLILSHQETGNGWSFARDRAVAAWARSAGITW